MKQKSNFTALWFIPLVAFVLAGILTVIGVIGWRLLKPAVPQEKRVVSARSVQGGSPRQTPTRPQPPVQPSNSSQPLLPKTGLSFSPARARFENALTQCLDREVYPCAWQDTQDGVIKQFTLTKPDGIVVRNIHHIDNTPLSQTAISLQGRVLLYRADNTTWYFDNAGLVRHIAVGTVANAGPDDPHDSYFYDVNGQLNACVCADNTQACCARAPQLPATTPHTYCALFAPDNELCPLP